MLKWLGCAVVAGALMVPTTASAGELRLSIANGRVTLVAQDVTLKQILDEWARVGQTTVVGAERLVASVVTLELHDVPETRALETLLRTASGYIAKPRTTAAVMGASTYDRILIMPPSRPPAVSATPQPFNRPQPQIVMPNVVVDDDGEPNPPSPIMPPGSVPQQFNQGTMQPGVQMQQPGMQMQQPGMQPGPQPVLTSPRPGMLPPPAPTVPGQFPQNPNQPIRPPGVPGPGGSGGGE
jgi:hypothetical protein